jgi:hypothetical protein
VVGGGIGIPEIQGGGEGCRCGFTLTATLNPTTAPDGHHYKYIWKNHEGTDIGRDESSISWGCPCGETRTYTLTVQLIRNADSVVVCEQTEPYTYSCNSEGSGSGSGSGSGA